MIRDTHAPVEVQSQRTIYSGAIWDIQQDTFTLPDTTEMLRRDYIVHPGAVAIVAVDAQHNIAMIRQYRHPVGQYCWEIPAGLLDVPGESCLASAQRELAEEVDLKAAQWSVLLDHHPSAGSSSEAIRVYLAQELTEVPEAQRHQRVAEEAQLTLQWVPLREAVAAVMAGDIKNVNAVAGILAARLVLEEGYPPRHDDGSV